MSNKKNVLKLAKKLRKKYTNADGQLWDGDLTKALIDYVGPDSTAEDALWDAYSIMKIVGQHYKADYEFRDAIDLHFSTNGHTGKKTVNGIKKFFLAIFNYYVPGYVEMLRMGKDPSRVTQDQLEYFESMYLNEEWRADLESKS